MALNPILLSADGFLPQVAHLAVLAKIPARGAMHTETC